MSRKQDGEIQDAVLDDDDDESPNGLREGMASLSLQEEEDNARNPVLSFLEHLEIEDEGETRSIAVRLITNCCADQAHPINRLEDLLRYEQYIESSAANVEVWRKLVSYRNFSKTLLFIQQQKEKNQPNTNTPPEQVDARLSVLGKIATVMTEAENNLAKFLRDDWLEKPRGVAPRSFVNAPVLGEVVGLSAIPTEMLKLFETSSPHDRIQRPACGMLNAVSGAGKTTTLQYCEQVLNNCAQEEIIPLVLAISFNVYSRGDDSDLTAEQGLTMRFAERFFMKDGGFIGFKNAWLKSDDLKGISLASLVSAILQLLPSGQPRLLLLIDEPGLAGDPSRAERKDTFPGSLPSIADKVVRLTAPLRGDDRMGVFTDATDFQRVAKNVRIVFSSLTPIFDQTKLKQETKTGGPIRWINVPYADAQDDSSLLNKTIETCGGLRERMSSGEFDDAMNLLIALSSGHWSTLDALLSVAKAGAELGCRADAKGWLRTIYLRNVRDALVQTPGTTELPRQRNKVFKRLLMLSILCEPVHPFEVVVDEEEKKKKHTLVSLAYDRVVLNRFPVEEAEFLPVVPLLSLLDVRRWCLETRNDPFVELVRGILHSAGNDPSNPEMAVASCNFAKAFEMTATHFILAKLMAWQTEAAETAFSFGNDYHESNQTECMKGVLFPGHTVAAGKNRFILPPCDPPRKLQIRGSGAFHAKLRKPSRKQSENDEAFSKRETEWFDEALRKLEFEGGENVKQLRPGDVLLPGSKIQAHSDGLLVTHWHHSGCTEPTTGLAFMQWKFSAGDSSTVVRLQDVIDGLDKLLNERGVLFDVDTSRGAQNQISKLGVKEEDVVYCWSVLRKLPTERFEFFEGIKKYATQVRFKGTILVAESAVLYGETFHNLALVFSSFGS